MGHGIDNEKDCLKVSGGYAILVTFSYRNDFGSRQDNGLLAVVYQIRKQR